MRILTIWQNRTHSRFYRQIRMQITRNPIMQAAIVVLKTFYALATLDFAKIALNRSKLSN